MGRTYANFTPVPPNNSLEVEFLRRHLGHERNKNLARDRLIIWLWKEVKVMFTCIALVQELPIAEDEYSILF